jgi:mannose-6-phosphate isomerase-like protein (cupin superfamily)|tara:strand:+ start:3137 stop:3829 length:693 start_codon:yes stop_codon:yes gene_type:complete
MKQKDTLYDNRLVKKPWGYEYVVYRNKNNLSVTLLKINYNQSTSLHCHPQKKSGFILLNGKALFQLGLWKKRSEIHSSPSKRMIARGLFHSIKSLSKKGLMALEFETPVNKKDLVRFKDSYGRRNKAYEGKKFTQSINSDFIKFKKPKFGQKQLYEFNNVKLVLEVHKNFTKILKNKPNTIFAILDGAVSDKNGRDVLSYGDIVRTSDLKVLSEVFTIKKQLSVAKVIKS